MQALGETLRAAREQKGVSASEAAKATKIKVQHIEALESEAFESMPAPIYAKGFIKLYAKYLGLEPDPLIAQYNAAHKPLSPDEIVGDAVKHPKPKKRKSGAPPQTSAEAPAAKGRSLWLLAGELWGSIRAATGRIKIPLGNWKQILTVLGGLLVLVLLISSLKNCAQRNSARQEMRKEDAGLIEEAPGLYLDAEKLPQSQGE